MNIQLDIYNIIDIISSVGALIFGVFFLLDKSKSKNSNKYLALSLLCLSGEILNSLVEGIDGLSGMFFPVFSCFTIVLLIFYVLSLVNQKIIKWLYIIIVIGLVFNVLLFFNNEIKETEIPYDLIINIPLLLWLAYFLKKHKKKLGNYYSYEENITLNWVYGVIALYLIMNIFWLIDDLLCWLFHDFSDIFLILTTVVNLVIVFWIGYFGFSQGDIFRGNLFVEKQNIDSKNSCKKTNNKSEELLRNKNTDDSVNNNLEQKFNIIQSTMVSEKLYLDPKLNLRTLSEVVAINEKEVSMLINKCASVNFFTFVNKFRIEEFKRLLTTKKMEEMSISGLAMESGFNSKSTFYSVFKKEEGITPKEYMTYQKES